MTTSDDKPDIPEVETAITVEDSDSDPEIAAGSPRRRTASAGLA